MEAPLRSPTFSAKRLAWILPLGVGLLTLVAFSPSCSQTYVWDDRGAILDNQHFRSLGWKSLSWMFTTTYTGPYQPLAWLTLAIDNKIGGIASPSQFHRTNVLLHLAGAVVFYMVARRLLGWKAYQTGRSGGRPSQTIDFFERPDPAVCWGAAAAMALFAVHPLRVESVAWITERRDVLCGLFFGLTILSYLRYCALPGGSPLRRGRYVTAVVMYALCLLSKGTAVSLPLVLLVLDVYPLRRVALQSKTLRSIAAEREIVEKTPFILLAMIAGLIALAGQASAGAMMGLSQHGLIGRVFVAFYGLYFYLIKTVLPFGLSPLYELPASLGDMWFRLLFSLAFVVGVTVLIVKRQRELPILMAAWIGYIVLLLPVLGIVQVGAHLVADRYSYLASMSVALLVGAVVMRQWQKASDSRRQNLFLRPAWYILGVTVLLILLTVRQCSYWLSNTTLWTRAVDVNPASAIAWYNLAQAQEGIKEGGLLRAIDYYRKAVECRPDFTIAWNNLGNAQASQGQFEEAVKAYKRVLEVDPKNVDALVNLSLALNNTNRVDEALRNAQRAIELDPLSALAHNTMGLALLQKNKIDEALEAFRKGTECNPAYPPPYENLARVLMAQRRYAEVVDILRKAVKHMPEHVPLTNTLAWLLCTCRRDDVRNGPEAVELALRVCEKTRYRNPHLLDTLAAAYAEIGAFDKAAETMQRSIDILSASDPAMAARYRERQQEYLAARPRRSD